MTDGPVIDDRDREQLLADLKELSEQYTHDWDPHSEDIGTTLLTIFSQYGTDVIQRLQSVPEKHRIAFLDMLDFSRHPPQSARMPLTFQVSEGLDENVAIPGGTQAVAETEEEENVIFEVSQEDGFEATSTSLETLYSVNPATDSIYSHDECLATGESTDLFDGEDLQEHVLYMGHSDLLNVEPGSELTVHVETNVHGETFEECVEWEYYGTDDEGEVGWHELPQSEDSVFEGDIDAGISDLEELQEEFRSANDTWGEGPNEFAFEFPGKTEDVEVGGVESRWIRCRAVGDNPDRFSIEIESLDIDVGRNKEDGRIKPDNVLSNDVPLSIDGDEDIFPFGRMPQPPSAFYVASEEAFTKKGAEAGIHLSTPVAFDGGTSIAAGDDDESTEDGESTEEQQSTEPGIIGGQPNISWEYWDGNGWSRLDIEHDGTETFHEPGTVTFTVPSDLEETTVSGHESYWVRARLVSGNYGLTEFELDDDGGGEMKSHTDPPRYYDVSIHYDQGEEEFETIFAYNNNEYSDDLTEQLGSFEPFDEPVEETQTLYLGFDGALHDGPINLYVPVEDATYPRLFEPGLEWEYCTDSRTDEWSKVEVHDGTGGLTERGIIGLNFPSETTASERFGRECHWVRARVTGDEFTPLNSDGVVRETAADGGATTDGSFAGEQPVGGMDAGDSETVETVTARDESTTPPTVEGVFVNTQWAYNTETVEDDVLGSSDGSHDQTFECAHAPVIELDVWVDESEALSKNERQTMAQTHPDRVEWEDGDTGFWVKWAEVDDFLDSGDEARHYVVDRTNGTVHFGDGQHGKIPPSGRDNVRATFKTGGGSDGNVERGAIEELRSPIPLISGIDNPRPSDGGADIESMEAVASRAPTQIRNRGRAVSAGDFEEVAMDASRELAKVKCEPEMAGSGNREPGWVTLLVVPEARREKPLPSMELKQRVRETVSERAPTTLVAHQPPRIVVRGPSYAEVSVDVTVGTSDVRSVSLLKERIEDRLDEYLHPLFGGTDGDGWAFGAFPDLSTIAALVDDSDGVDEIQHITMTYVENGEEITVKEGDAPPQLPRDTLITSADHNITVTMTGGT